MRSWELGGAYGAVASRKSLVASNIAHAAVIGVLVYWCIGVVLRRLSFVVCRLRLVGSRQSAVGSDVAFGDGIGHRSLGAGLEPCIAGLKSRLLSIASRSDAPKLFTIHHSPFTIRKRSFRFRFLTPHSSLFASLILSDKERK